MQGLFTDFLCYRGPSMGAYQDVPFGEDGEHMWLGGMTQAAQDLDIEVQYCMALAHQVVPPALPDALEMRICNPFVSPFRGKHCRRANV